MYVQDVLVYIAGTVLYLRYTVVILSLADLLFREVREVTLVRNANL